MSIPDFSDVSKPMDGRTGIPAPILTTKMPVPAFSDIAKPSNDLLNKDFYHVTAATLDVKLKTPNGVNLNVKGKQGFDGATSGSVEGKYTVQPQGITITQGWTTTNNLDTKFEAENVIAQGVKAEVQSLFNPKSGSKGQKLNLFFKNPSTNARAFLDYAPGGNINALVDAVVGHDGFLLGAEAGYDVQRAAITRYSAALGYQTPMFTASLAATNNMSIMAASYYQKVNSAVEAGAKATYDTKSGNNVGLELVSKYKLDPTSFAKAKINDRGIAALAYNVKVNKGVTFGVGLSLDTQKLNEAGHKIGTSFTFEG
ncbi:eukaryotic porin/Tom40 [Cryomyces antarcticus]